MGRVLAFGGRVMDQSLPKYLNSQETPVFNKRHNLYGLNFVKRQHKPEQLFVMEGYMDVVSVAQPVSYTHLRVICIRISRGEQHFKITREENDDHSRPNSPNHQKVGAKPSGKSLAFSFGQYNQAEN